MQSFIRWGLSAAMAAMPFASVPASAAPADYAITARWNLPGSGGWDYLSVDSPRHRLFVTHGDHVDVVDTATGKRIGGIAATPGVHAVVLAPDLHRGFTTNGRNNSITEFDYDSLAVLRTVAVPGENPDAGLYDPDTQLLFTFNGRSKDASVFDARSLTVRARIALPGKPEFAVRDGHGRVFVNIESEVGKIAVIDTKTLKRSAVWSLATCVEPSGLAIDLERRRLFSVCDNRTLAITDARSGAGIARVAIGAEPDAVAWDAARGLVFSSNGEGTLSIVRMDPAGTYAAAATLPTLPGARTLAMDPISGRLYLVSARFGPPAAPSAAQPHPRPQPLADTFTVLVVDPVQR